MRTRALIQYIFNTLIFLLNFKSIGLSKLVLCRKMQKLRVSKKET